MDNIILKTGHTQRKPITWNQLHVISFIETVSCWSAHKETDLVPSLTCHQTRRMFCSSGDCHTDERGDDIGYIMPTHIALITAN